MLNEQTAFGVIINIVLIIFLLLLLNRYHRGNVVCKQQFALLGIFLFCLFSFWGRDWYGYLHYTDIFRKGYGQISMEPFYVWLLSLIEGNYFLFRSIVWGGAIVFFYKTIKRTELNINLVLYLFCGIYLIFFSYARATLCMAVIFFGYSLLYSHRKKYNQLAILIGISIIFAAFYLHKSSIFGIGAALISAIIMKRENKIFSSLLLLTPVIIFLLYYYFSSSGIAFSESSTFADYTQAGNVYLAANMNYKGIGAMISTFLERLPYYLVSILCFLEIRQKKRAIPRIVGSFLVMLIVIVFLSTFFLIDFGVNTTTLYGRFLRFGQIPACIALAYFYQNNLYAKFVDRIIFIAFISTFYSLMYVTYNLIMQNKII